CEAIENPLKRPNAFGGKTPLHIDGVKIECKDVKAREYYRGAKLLLDVGREHLAKSISDAEWIVCLVSDKRYNLATDHRRIFENTAALAEKKFKEVKQSEKHDFMKDLATEADRNLKAVETLRKNVADALSPKN
ncbi:MAG: hypothetical protein NTV88_06285, partial [Candidatus Micrarchaeota archaeon]|nr:hypothetical protein [Candidatus Micrarchaeota archaeon]